MNDNPREAKVLVRCWCGHVENEYGIHRAEADLPAPSATCECGHDEDSHLEGQEADLDGRPVGKPYTYCHWCVNEDRADRWHDFKPAPAASQSVEEAREALVFAIKHAHATELNDDGQCAGNVHGGPSECEPAVIQALAAFERAVTEASQNRERA